MDATTIKPKQRSRKAQSASRSEVAAEATPTESKQKADDHDALVSPEIGEPSAPAQDAAEPVEVPKPRTSRRQRTISAFRQLLFSSLTRRILFFNLFGLAVLLLGILYLNQFREGLVEAYTRSLVTQGKIIASAIASSATYDIDTITIDPDKLMELQAGESTRPTINSLDSLDSGIDPEVIAPLLRSLVQPTRTRARVYDQEGALILDSKFLYSGGQVLRYDLPGSESTSATETEWFSSKQLGDILNWLLRDRNMPIYRDVPEGGRRYPEVNSALTGATSTFVRATDQGQQIVSVAVPVQRLRIVSGVLLLSTEPGEIDRFVTDERLAILRLFLIAAIVLMVLSVVLAGTIANPLRRLSEAANRVRRGVNSREEIPDYSKRHDEIGTLSTSIRDMTNALYSRIEAIERFAADVSHELKNPLTSLRSAVETLPLAKTEDSQKRLHAVIQHDVKRLDRLITDISDASRLDAELAREQADQVDVKVLLENIVSMLGTSDSITSGKRGGRKAVRIDLQVTPAGRSADWMVLGHESRLAQVFINLIENAKSFVPAEDGNINVALGKQAGHIIIAIEDNGPGIPPDNLERVFERFYTDRPEEQGFGQNSGLGLSISRQIIEAHGGTISASNSSRTGGAVFSINLPAAGTRK